MKASQKLLAALGLQLLFFASWAGYEEWRHARGGEYLLETRPYDPRDLISGKYLQMRLRIADTSSLPGFSNRDSYASGEVALRLTPCAEVMIKGRPLTLLCAASIMVPAPEALPELPQGELWVRPLNKDLWNLNFGVERYYFSEARQAEMDKMRPGDYYARVRIGKDGKMRLLGIEEKK